jgi:hypothetical protein
MINGWQLAPIVHITSGQPFTVTSGVDNSFTSGGVDRPNVVPGAQVYTHNAIRSQNTPANRQYLNAAAFSSVTAGCPFVSGSTTVINVLQCPGYGTFGNVSRMSYRGPNYVQTDASLSRIFAIHEAMKLQLRLEAFNFLNHPYFSTPTATTSSSTFGQVTSTSTAGEGPRVFQAAIKFNF